MIRTYITIILSSVLLLISVSAAANTFDDGKFSQEWAKADSLEQEGLLKPAFKIVDEIYTMAKAENNSEQLIKAVIFKIKYKNELKDGTFVGLIKDIENELYKSKFPVKNILHSMLADMYWMYYKQNRIKIYGRKNIIDFDDIGNWTMGQIIDASIKHHMFSLSNKEKLQTIPVEEFKELIVVGEGAKELWPSVYDFLAHKALFFFKDNELSLSRPKDFFQLKDNSYFFDASEFSNLQIQSPDTLSFHFYAIKIYRELLDFRVNDTNVPALINVDLERLNFVYKFSVNQDKDSLYYTYLQQLAKKYEKKKEWTKINYCLANYYFNNNKKKKALELCEQSIAKYPKSFGASQCNSLKSKILNANLGFKAEAYIASGQKFPVLINYKNIDTVYVKIARINAETVKKLQEKYSDKNLYNKLLLSIKQEKNTMRILPKADDYEAHRTELILPEQTLGTYIVFIANNEKFSYEKNTVSYLIIQTTDISYMKRKAQNGDLAFYVLNRKNGLPMKSVLVKSWYKTYDFRSGKHLIVPAKNYFTDKNGYFKVSAQSAGRNKNLYFEFIKGTDVLKTKLPVYIASRNPYKSEYTRVHLFTDKAIYRLGQKVYFKGIVIESRNGKPEISGLHKKIQICFHDADKQIIGKQDLSVNEYGSFNGSFIIPKGLPNGKMEIYTPLGSKYIQVAAYKKPKFEIGLLPFNGNYVLNDTLMLKGFVKTFAKVNISNAKLTYSISRIPLSDSREISQNSVQITSGRLVADKNGNFTLKFVALPDLSVDKNKPASFKYLISIDATDINGETQSLQQTVTVGYSSLMLDLKISDFLQKDKADKLQILSYNQNGAFIPAKGKISCYKLKSLDKPLRGRIWEQPDKYIYSHKAWDLIFPGNVYADENKLQKRAIEKEIFSMDFDTKKEDSLDISRLKNEESGVYVFVVKSKDAFGNELEQKKYFSLFSEKDAEPARKQINYFGVLTKKVEPGKKAVFLIGSAAKDVTVLYEIELHGQIIEKQWINLDKNQKIIEIPVKEEYQGNFSVHFSFVQNGRLYRNSALVKVPYSSKNLEIAFESFRNKLYPGEQEVWSIKINNKKGKRVKAEILATLYDAALDKSVPNKWPFNIYKRHDTQLNWSSDVFNKRFATPVSKGFNKNIPMPYPEYAFFNWFGFDQFSVPELSGVVDEKNNTNEHKNDFQNIQVRKNSAETVFFYPELRTDIDGKLNIKFTVPESHTKWHMMVFAHSKDLSCGFVEKELITQKDLMVSPNPPRFFRQGDKFVFSVKLSNSSKEKMEGIAYLSFFDALSMKLLNNVLAENELGDKLFSVDAKGNSVVNWKLQIPDSVQAIVYKVVAKSGKFSDGEQKAVPVLNRQVLVSETMPVFVNGRQSKAYELKNLVELKKSKTIEKYKLTFELTSNPAWYALQALPYLMKQDNEFVLQTFNRFYANSIAAHIINSSPKIKQLFKAWKNTEITDSFLSKLEKNEDLKAILLSEMPWILDMQKEQESKKCFALLFEQNKMNSELNHALSRLEKAQLPKGAWPWQNGIVADDYTTQSIVAGFGRLDKPGFKKIRKDEKTWLMLRRAINYLDRKLTENYANLKKQVKTGDLQKNYLNHIILHYFYARSFFLDVKIPEKTKEAFEFYKKQMKKYWTDQDLYSKAMIALVAGRYNMAFAKDVLALLKETAIHKMESGMYWKKNKAGYLWYQSPISTQTLMIEVFGELGKDNKTVSELKTWLLQQKRLNNRKNTKATSEAVYALLLNETDWSKKEKSVKVKIGKQHINIDTRTDETDYFKRSWFKNNIKPEMGKLTIESTDKGFAYGALCWQYFEDVDKVKVPKSEFKLEKKLYLVSAKGLKEINKKTKLKTGDKITVRLVLKVGTDMEYLHIKDLWASGLEPQSFVSGNKFIDGIVYYESTKDASTSFFIPALPKGTYVFEHMLVVTHSGVFSTGLATVQSIYAADFLMHSKSKEIVIKH
jgi:uncharacterized protein YfaS (alpha-2-macroglobulin family)